MEADRILVVEDDLDVQTIVADTLRDAAFRVAVAGDGMHALLALDDDPVDLVVLDLGLPDMSGEHVLLRLRRTSRVPVVVLSARADITERAHLRRLGADECMLKPFYPEDLVASIARHLRRPAADAPTFGSLRVDLHEGRAHVGEVPLALLPEEFALLAALARTPARVWAWNELRRELALEEGPTAVLEKRVADLKQKLRRHGAGGALRIVRNVGCALVAPAT